MLSCNETLFSFHQFVKPKIKTTNAGLNKYTNLDTKKCKNIFLDIACTSWLPAIIIFVFDELMNTLIHGDYDLLWFKHYQFKSFKVHVIT